MILIAACAFGFGCTPIPSGSEAAIDPSSPGATATGGTVPSPSGHRKMRGAEIRAVVDNVLGPNVFLWSPSGSMTDGSAVVIGSDRNRVLTAGIKLSGADDDLQIIELYDAPVQIGEEPSALAMAIVGAVVPEAETWIRSQPALARPEKRSFGGLDVVWAGGASINEGRYLVLVISAWPIPTGK